MTFPPIRAELLPVKSDQQPAASRSVAKTPTYRDLLHPASSIQPFTLLIFAKYPEAGKVKTRLANSIGDLAAALLYEQFIRQVLKIGQQSGAVQIFVAVAPTEQVGNFREKFAGDFQFFAQAETSDLGERIIAAMRHVLTQGHEKIVIIGTDSPNLPLAYVQEATAALDAHDMVLGPAEDGGYYLIGLKKIFPELFANVAWSSSQVLAQTLEHARRLNLRVHLLPTWYDVDDLPAYQRLVRDNPEFSQEDS